MQKKIKIQICFLLVMILPLAGGFHDQDLIFIHGSYEPWRWITAHLTHIDAGHWFWNWIAGAALLAYLGERDRSGVLCVSLLTAMTINVYLFFLYPLNSYAGLSGILNAWMVLAIAYRYQETKSGWVILASAIYLAKLLVELLNGLPATSANGWQPVPVAHLVGAAIGLIYFFIIARIRKNLFIPNSNMKNR